MGDVVDAYGTPAYGTPTTPFGYSGQYLDATTGLVNDQARWYEPQSGGFTTRDPAFAQTDTAYTYAGGDPVDNTDPRGLCLQGPPDAPPISCSGKPLPVYSGPSTTPLNVNGFVTTWCGNNPDPSGQQYLASCNKQTAILGSVTGTGSSGWMPNFDDPSIPPGPGWIWRGPPPQGGEFGAYVNPKLPGVSLHPDLSHSGDAAEHYDLNLPDKSTWRWYRGDWFQLRNAVGGQLVEPKPWTNQELQDLNDYVGLSPSGGLTGPEPGNSEPGSGSEPEPEPGPPEIGLEALTLCGQYQ